MPKTQEQAIPPPTNPNPAPSPRSGIPPPVAYQFRPGQSGNPGGKPVGCSTQGPFLRRLAENPNEYGEGAEAVAIAEELIRAAKGGDAKAVAAILGIMDRTDGPLIKERINTNIEVLQDVELRDRRERPAPGTETKA